MKLTAGELIVFFSCLVVWCVPNVMFSHFRARNIGKAAKAPCIQFSAQSFVLWNDFLLAYLWRSRAKTASPRFIFVLITSHTLETFIPSMFLPLATLITVAKSCCRPR